MMTKQILAVGQNKDKAVLTKPQKEFNRLTKKIAGLQAEVQAFEEASNRLQQDAQKDLAPLVRQFAERRADMVRLFDRAWESGNFKAKEKKKLADCIGNMALDLIANHGLEELKPIFDKHSKTPYDQVEAEAEEGTEMMMRRMMQMMFGVDIPEDVDVSTPEKMEAYMAAQMAQQQAAYQEQQRRAEKRRAQRPKTAKQLEREEKKALKEQKQAEEAAKVSKSVREVYLDLVKAFHPDREPNEAERARKTAVMQRVTAAYEENNLLALLQLQLEFERIDQEHLENIAEERLVHFNKILRRQAAELDEFLWEIKVSLADLTSHSPYEITSPVLLAYWLKDDLKNMKRNIREIEADLRELAQPAALRDWLKDYRN